MILGSLWGGASGKEVGPMSMRKVAIIILIIALMGISVPGIRAEGVNEYSNVLITPMNNIIQLLEGVGKGDSVHIEVQSDMEVNILLIGLLDWTFGYHEEALWEGYYKDHASFRVDIPDDQEYCLVIENQNNVSVWVDYSYTVEGTEDVMEDLASLYCMICGIAGTVLLILCGIVLTVILVSLSKKKNKKADRRDQEIEKLENRIREMERSGMDTSRERKLLERYKNR